MSDNNTERIINEIYKYRLLYDTSHPEYKNNRKKDLVWKEIGEKLEQNIYFYDTSKIIL